MEIRQMWEEGPLREYSLNREKQGQAPLDSGGYAGMYVCGECGASVVGVYRVANNWICSACKTGRKPS